MRLGKSISITPCFRRTRECRARSLLDPLPTPEAGIHCDDVARHSRCIVPCRRRFARQTCSRLSPRTGSRGKSVAVARLPWWAARCSQTRPGRPWTVTSRDGTRVRAWSSSRRSAAFGVPHPVLDSRRPPVSSPCGRPYGRHPRHFTCHAPKSAQGISARHGVHPWQSQARPAIFGTRSAGLGSVAISSATSEATRPSPGSVSRRSISSAST